jgi:hypothetical protein
MREKILEIIKQAGRSRITTLEIYRKLSPAYSIISIHEEIHKMADDGLIDLVIQERGILHGCLRFKQITVKIKKKNIYDKINGILRLACRRSRSQH